MSCFVGWWHSIVEQEKQVCRVRGIRTEPLCVPLCEHFDPLLRNLGHTGRSFYTSYWNNLNPKHCSPPAYQFVITNIRAHFLEALRLQRGQGGTPSIFLFLKAHYWDDIEICENLVRATVKAWKCSWSQQRSFPKQSWRLRTQPPSRFPATLNARFTIQSLQNKNVHCSFKQCTFQTWNFKGNSHQHWGFWSLWSLRTNVKRLAHQQPLKSISTNRDPLPPVAQQLSIASAARVHRRPGSCAQSQAAISSHKQSSRKALKRKKKQKKQGLPFSQSVEANWWIPSCRTLIA